jgi:hypothetical protein
LEPEGVGDGPDVAPAILGISVQSKKALASMNQLSRLQNIKLASL